MEIVETSLTPLQRRARLARVGWADLAAQQRARGDRVRPLAPGDDVQLHVDGHTVHRGRVLRYDGTGPDGAYVITIGAPMARSAARRTSSRRSAARGAEPLVQDVEVRVVPMQRTGRVSLYL